MSAGIVRIANVDSFDSSDEFASPGIVQTRYNPTQPQEVLTTALITSA